jgi:hypothetical protein
VIEEDLREPGDLARLRERIEALENPSAMLLDLRITGLLSAQDRDELQRIEEITASRFVFGRVDQTRVRPSPSDDAWIAGVAAGALREAATRLRELADPAYAGPRADGASPGVACRALLELYALASEAP